MKIETCPHTKNNNKQTYPIKKSTTKIESLWEKSVVICSCPFVPLLIFVEKKINTGSSFFGSEYTKITERRKKKKRLVNRRWTLLKKEKKNHEKLKKFESLKSTHVINVYYLCKRAFVWCCNMIIGYEIKKKLKKRYNLHVYR